MKSLNTPHEFKNWCLVKHHSVVLKAEGQL